MKQQKGFTLIELIIVIVILGILAAYAVPKYMNIDKEARIAVVKGLEGSIRSATSIVHAIAVVKKADAGITGNMVNIGETNIKLTDNLYPIGADDDGIAATLSGITGFTLVCPKLPAQPLLPTEPSVFDQPQPVTGIAGKVTRFEKMGALNPAKCSVTYDMSGKVPKITRDTRGC